MKIFKFVFIDFQETFFLLSSRHCISVSWQLLFETEHYYFNSEIISTLYREVQELYMQIVL